MLEEVVLTETSADGRVIAKITASDDVIVDITVEGFHVHKELLLHWGVGASKQEWIKPPTFMVPNTKTESLVQAARSIFEASGRDRRVQIVIQSVHKKDLPEYLHFVMFSPPNSWIKAGTGNYSINLRNFFVGDALKQEIALRHPHKSDAIRSFKFKAGDNTYPGEFLVSCSTTEMVVDVFCEYPHRLTLHWGFVSNVWVRPDIDRLIKYPNSTYHPIDAKSCQTHFQFLSPDGESCVQYARIGAHAEIVPTQIGFVLKEYGTNLWFNNALTAGDFIFDIPQLDEWIEKRNLFKKEEEKRAIERATRIEAEKAAWDSTIVEFRQSRKTREDAAGLRFVSFSVEVGDIDVGVSVNEEEAIFIVSVKACLRSPLLFHWGVSEKKGSAREWLLPPEYVRPAGSVVADPVRACHTPFSKSETPFLYELEIIVKGENTPKTTETDTGLVPDFKAINFVLKDVDGPNWYKQNDGDMQINMAGRPLGLSGPHEKLVGEILSAELEWNHMTLMHRFNLINSIVSGWNLSLPPSRNMTDYELSWGDVLKVEDTRTFPTTITSLKSVIFPDDSTDALNREFWGWIFTWSRLSFLGLLDWQRNYNTKPRELSHASETLSLKITELWINVPRQRPLILRVLATMGRGGNQGQAIRDRILDIQHKHKIPEHRKKFNMPADANFYEQWHQKLHNNTTPDDIPICKAVIGFLRSGGDLNEYRRILSEHGITKERLASYERKIVAEPYWVHTDVQSLINDFCGYLDILIDVHDALDLRKAAMHARAFLGGDAQRDLDEAVNAALQGIGTDPGHALYVFQKISQVRRSIILSLNSSKQLDIRSTRELLFLDFVLEQQQGLICQSTIKFNTHQLVSQFTDLLIALSGHSPSDSELRTVCSDWYSIAPTCVANKFGTGSVESALMLKALLDRISRVVGETVVNWQELLQPKIEFLGDQLGLEKRTVDLFVDEVLRGTALLSISLTMKKIEPILHEAAKLPPWQLISLQHRVQGVLVWIDKLVNIQDQVFDVPTILLSGAVSGEEEIPTGVQAVLVRSAAESPDILSHVSVRARQANVLLAVCFEPAVAQQMESMLDQWVEIIVAKDGSKLEMKPAERPPTLKRQLSRMLAGMYDRSVTQELVASDHALMGRKAKAEMDLRGESKTWVIPSDEFKRGLVGGKSDNLKNISSLMPNMLIPSAVALPFGCMQKALGAPKNKSKRDELEKVLSTLGSSTSNAEAHAVFLQASSIMESLDVPEGFHKELMEVMRKVDADVKSTDGYSRQPLASLAKDNGEEAVWKSVCRVWSSLFGLRPWVSLSKAGRSYQDLQMAVLVQELFPASYSFVVHSKNPFSEKEGEMYGELVAGLGEVLVGNYPGRSLSWLMPRNGTASVVAFPSKSVALRGRQSLIFRSDSNGEDLEGFAGAGLFESVQSNDANEVRLRYSNLKLLRDLEYRQFLISEIGKMTFALADKFGGEVDAEGVVIGESTICLVQVRPQV